MKKNAAQREYKKLSGQINQIDIQKQEHFLNMNQP